MAQPLKPKHRQSGSRIPALGGSGPSQKKPASGHAYTGSIPIQAIRKSVADRYKAREGDAVSLRKRPGAKREFGERHPAREEDPRQNNRHGAHEGPEERGALEGSAFQLRQERVQPPKTASRTTYVRRGETQGIRRIDPEREGRPLKPLEAQPPFQEPQIGQPPPMQAEEAERRFDTKPRSAIGQSAQSPHREARPEQNRAEASPRGSWVPPEKREGIRAPRTDGRPAGNRQLPEEPQRWAPPGAKGASPATFRFEAKGSPHTSRRQTAQKQKSQEGQGWAPPESYSGEKGSRAWGQPERQRNRRQPSKNSESELYSRIPDMQPEESRGWPPSARREADPFSKMQEERAPSFFGEAGSSAPPKSAAPMGGGAGAPSSLDGAPGSIRRETSSWGEGSFSRREASSLGEPASARRETSSWGEASFSRREASSLRESGPARRETASLREAGPARRETSSLGSTAYARRETSSLGATASLKGATSSLRGATASLKGATSSLKGATSSLKGVAGSPKDAVLAAVIARRRKRQKKSAIASLAFIAIVSISAIAFATGASPVDAFSGIPALFAPEATVIPKQQSELQKISPGEKFDFGVKTSKGQELSDPSDLVMFFSNSALCTRPSYSVICINEDAENGSLVEVRLKAGDASETYRFLVCDSLSRTAENGVVTNPSSLTAYINRQRALPADYKPAGLKVPTIRYSYGAETQKYKLRSEAAAAAEQMFTAAKAEGHALLGKKGYQSYADAKKAYDAYAAANGKEKAEKNAKAPGTDEHQTGYALDITAFTASYEIVKDFNSSAAGKWAAAHAYEFGFIQRYPPGSQEKTGYPAEAGHYRYVGVTLAAYLKEANLTLDEFFAE